jgi:hypothetical protein
VSVNHKVLARARAGRQAPGRGRFRNRRRAAAWVGSALLLGLAGDGWGCRAGADQRAGAQYPPPAGGLAGAGTYACSELGTGKPVLDRSGNCAPTSLTLRGAQMDLGPPGFLRVVFGGAGARRGFPDRGCVWAASCVGPGAMGIHDSVGAAGGPACDSEARRSCEALTSRRACRACRWAWPVFAGSAARSSEALARDSETNLWARFAFM